MKAGPIEKGEERGGYFLAAPYRWAKREAHNVTLQDGQRVEVPIMVEVSRSEHSQHYPDGVSFVLFLGGGMDTPGLQMEEQEFRDLLVAAGCKWAEGEPE